MDIELIAAAADDLVRPSPALAAARTANFADQPDELDAVLETITRLRLPSPWGAYWGMADGEIVGVCAFKATPDPSGTVEIAYYTFPPQEGRGAATGMAAALLETARQGGASTVIAHTLPVANASVRVLGKLGFVFQGEAEDPEDGPVWAWRRAL